MADSTIRIEGLPELKQIMKEVGSLRPVKIGLRTGAQDFIGAIKNDKPPVSRRPQALYWSDKQRRGFFAKLRSGEIEVPYIRGSSRKSESMSKSWTAQARHGGLTQVVGNDTSYGPMVQDPVEQIRYHKDTGWKDTDALAQRHGRKVNEAVKGAIDRALAKAR